MHSCEVWPVMSWSMISDAMKYDHWCHEVRSVMSWSAISDVMKCDQWCHEVWSVMSWSVISDVMKYDQWCQTANFTVWNSMLISTRTGKKKKASFSACPSILSPSLPHNPHSVQHITQQSCQAGSTTIKELHANEKTSFNGQASSGQPIRWITNHVALHLRIKRYEEFKEDHTKRKNVNFLTVRSARDLGKRENERRERGGESRTSGPPFGKVKIRGFLTKRWKPSQTRSRQILIKMSISTKAAMAVKHGSSSLTTQWNITKKQFMQ